MILKNVGKLAVSQNVKNNIFSSCEDAGGDHNVARYLTKENNTSHFATLHYIYSLSLKLL